MHRFLILMGLLLVGGCTPMSSPPSGPTAPASFVCPMHPSVRATSPGSCPICKMALTAVTADAAETGEVVVDPVRRQRFGVRTAVVERRALAHDLRAFGTVRWDTSRLADVVVRGDTFIEELHVLETGTTVRRGQPLARIYSPMLYAAQREFMASRGSERELSKHERLKLLGLSQGQITRLAASGVVSETTELLSPENGVIVMLDVIRGAHLMEGSRFARIARLDEVWVEGEVFEEDVALVKIGAAVTVTVGPAALQGVVDRVEPWVDPMTRRAKFRATVKNPEGLLLPNMYVDVALRVDLGEQLAVPAEAVITTGERRIVFVDAGQDRLVPRDVAVGRRAGEWFEVRAGLEAGDPVVTSGVFLVASESRIRASETWWGRAPKPPVAAEGATQSAAPVSGRASPAPQGDKPLALHTPGLIVLEPRHVPPGAWGQKLAVVVDAYLATKDALVKGDVVAASSAAGRVRSAVVDTAALPPGAPADAWKAQAQVLSDAADRLAKATSLVAQREELFALSEATYAAAWSFEHGKRPLFLQVCPMAHEDKGGAPWLSAEAQIKNPYFGDAMLACGETKRALR